MQVNQMPHKNCTILSKNAVAFSVSIAPHLNSCFKNTFKEGSDTGFIPNLTPLAATQTGISDGLTLSGPRSGGGERLVWNVIAV